MYGYRLWRDVYQAYFGKTYSPRHIDGEYRPSPDWELWSGVPLE